MAGAAIAAIKTERVQFAGDRITLTGYLARPTIAQPCHAVVVLHEWWGLSDHITRLCDRLAHEGFVALAPNLYDRQGGEVTADPARAAKLMEGVSSQLALRDLNRAISFLKAQPFVDPYAIGLAGLSMGGSLALTMAGHNSDLKAVAVFYGKVPPVETFKYFVCPIQFHHAKQDDWVTTREVETLQNGLAQHGKPAEIFMYDAPHAFFNESRPAEYRPGEAAKAWERMLAFLARHVK